MGEARHSAWLRTLVMGVACLWLLSPIVPAQARCASQKVSPSQLRGDAVQSNWLQYRNSKDGLSFRYPPSMQVKGRDPRPLYLDVTPEVVVDLMGNEPNNPDITVIRFICYRGRKTPEAAASKARVLLKTHPTDNPSGRVNDGAIGTMQVDGHEAIISCSCGRAACSYTIYTLQPYSCRILPMVAGDGFGDNYPPPHDGMFPVLSIIRTVHFKPVSK